MKDILVKEITVQSPEYQQVWQLREDVLRKPLGLSLKDEDLSGDANDIILVAMLKDKVVGCIILHKKEGRTMKLRQMAIAENMQGQNIGKLLVVSAEMLSMAYGYNKTDMHARMVAKGFYEKMGYKASGDIFTEVGIPHVKMNKILMPG